MPTRTPPSTGTLTRRSLCLAALLATTLASTLAFAPLAHAVATVTGSGTLKSETRAVSGFQAIASNGAIELVLRQASREGVEVRADDNLLPLIETRVVDGTLEIRTVPGASYRTRHAVTVTVDLLTLKALSIASSGDATCERLKTPALELNLAGSGNARFADLATDALEVSISGSGKLKAAGQAPRLTVSIAGSGDVDTRSLVAEEVSVSIAGSGDARVNARKTIAVTVAGSGSVTYTGDAALRRRIVGSGSVLHR